MGWVHDKTGMKFWAVGHQELIVSKFAEIQL